MEFAFILSLICIPFSVLMFVICLDDNAYGLCGLAMLLLALSLVSSLVAADAIFCNCCENNHMIQIDEQCLIYQVDEDGNCKNCNHDIEDADCDKTEVIVTCHCCQTEVEADEKYCSQCGNELKQEILSVSENTITYCTGCGVELQPEDKYCGSCGKQKIR